MNAGEPLLRILGRAREFGFLGPGPVEAHMTHALGFIEVIGALAIPATSVLDLGTGGGVPGLVIADRFREAKVVLLEASQRRAEFLRDSVEELEAADRVEIVHERGEQAAHRAGLREQFSIVTARSFAEPAVTAEIATGFLTVGGRLVVSEPPTPDPGRWPADELAELGLGPALPNHNEGGHFVAVTKVHAAPGGVPRPVGRPAKRPRW